MKSIIRKFIFFCLRMLPLKDYIILESAPNVADNTRKVYEELVRRGINKKYKLIWWLYEGEYYGKKYSNVTYILCNNILRRMSFLYYKERAKCIICCNRFLTSTRKGQMVFYLGHGTPLKSTRGYYTVPQGIDYLFAASKEIVDLLAYELNTSTENIIALGYPRNDDLIGESKDLFECFGQHYRKLIVWYPTFRQHKSSTTVYQGASLPILHSAEQANKLNEVAKKLHTLIILKPHFAQNVEYIKKMKLSNLIFIDDDFLAKNDISSYEFVRSCDALITDYSSIYYDYTLCNKPIAITLDDKEEYSVDTGLIEEFDYYTKGADRIYDLSDLVDFIQNVVNGVDNRKNEREEIRDLVNYSNNGGNAERVTNFIMEKAKL